MLGLTLTSGLLPFQSSPSWMFSRVGDPGMNHLRRSGTRLRTSDIPFNYGKSAGVDCSNRSMELTSSLILPNERGPLSNWYWSQSSSNCCSILLVLLVACPIQRVIDLVAGAKYLAIWNWKSKLHIHVCRGHYWRIEGVCFQCEPTQRGPVRYSVCFNCCSIAFAYWVLVPYNVWPIL